MNTKILIDSIMRQTTVLIAQLATSAGIRAPMARLADEVFLTLSEELESQGVSRKVVADMFGMALRGYQKRVQRVRESSTEPSTTLWQAVLGFVEHEGPITRRALLDRFQRDDPDAVRSVLHDLMTSGLILRQGAGGGTRLVALPEEGRRALARKGSRALVETMVWLDLTHHAGTQAREVADRLAVDVASVDEALVALEEAGRLSRSDGGALTAESIYIPVGAEAGWETAIFDHFQAACVALVTKLRRGATRAAADDTTGGGTITYDIHDDHPERERVLSLLRSTRAQSIAAWEAVEEHNQDHPVPPGKLRQVTFYYGQCVHDTESEEPS